MSDRAKKISELPSIGTANTSVASGDLFPVVDVSANTTKYSTLSTLRKSIIQGPFADDAAANTAGVELGQPYYTAAGDVKVRIS